MVSAATDIVLSTAEIERLETAAALPPLYPHWHIASAHDRPLFAALGQQEPSVAGGGGRGDIAQLAGAAKP